MHFRIDQSGWQHVMGQWFRDIQEGDTSGENTREEGLD